MSSSFRKRLQRATHSLANHSRDAVDKGLDRHVNIAVTGLSGAGKTAFITGVLEQLQQPTAQRLAFFRAAREGRLRGARLAAQPRQTVARFAYERGYQCITAETDASWPPSTTNFSEIRSVLRVARGNSWRDKLRQQLPLQRDYSELTIDIADYPGEWLLDLPLLGLSFEQWSAQQRERLQQTAWAAQLSPFMDVLLAELNALETTAELSEAALELITTRLAQAYAQNLQQARLQGFSWLQPGRALLPGDLADAPVVTWFPWLVAQPPAGTAQQALWALLEKRYQAYREQVVKPFFARQVARCNRQVLLIDVLGALRAGKPQLDDLQQCLQQLLPSFDYGRNSWWRRLWKPRIERVSVVATKADTLLPEQHPQLQRLLQELVQPITQQLAYEGIAVQTEVVAAVQATVVGADSVLGRVACAATGSRWLNVRPPALPERIQQFSAALQYTDFLPLGSSGEYGYALDAALPHIRLDKVLQFLLDDLL